MAADVIRLEPYRQRRAVTPDRRVECPHCGAAPGRSCVVRGTKFIRPEGAHPERRAVAEAEGER